jgi:hypothetical protein
VRGEGGPAVKRVALAYARSGLSVEVPDHAQVVRPRPVAAGKRRVVVTHSDITRATPNDRILPVLLQALERAGVKRGDITLINALGTHRRQTEAELRQMLGADLVARYRCTTPAWWRPAPPAAAMPAASTAR